MKPVLILSAALLGFSFLSLDQGAVDPDTSGDLGPAASTRSDADRSSGLMSVGTISRKALPRGAARAVNAGITLVPCDSSSTGVALTGETILVEDGFESGPDAMAWATTQEGKDAVLAAMMDEIDGYLADFECTGCWNGEPGCEGEMFYVLENGQVQFRAVPAGDGWALEIEFRESDGATLTCTPCED
jgi:hypothetical protein